MWPLARTQREHVEPSNHTVHSLSSHCLVLRTRCLRRPGPHEAPNGYHVCCAHVKVMAQYVRFGDIAGRDWGISHGGQPLDKRAPTVRSAWLSGRGGLVRKLPRRLSVVGQYSS